MALPSERSAQVWAWVRLAPLLMDANCSPPGGDACPLLSSPQQTALPSGRSAHVWAPPLLSVVCCTGARKSGKMGVGVGTGVGGGRKTHQPQPSDARNPASVGRMATRVESVVVCSNRTSALSPSILLSRAQTHVPDTSAASYTPGTMSPPTRYVPGPNAVRASVSVAVGAADWQAARTSSARGRRASVRTGRRSPVGGGGECSTGRAAPLRHLPLPPSPAASLQFSVSSLANNPVRGKPTLRLTSAVTPK